MAEGSEAAVDTPKQENAQSAKIDFFETSNEPPNWLNREFMEKALREYEKDQSLHIFDCEIIPATKPGDNFASVVFRANVKYTAATKTESKSIIVKVKPFVDGFKKDLLGMAPLFQTEGSMYMNVLPEMQRLLTQIGDNEIMSPGLIYYGTDPEIIMFEDIAPQGYVMRHMGMNFENTKKVILKLAKFHALSFHMYYDEKKDLDEYKAGLITTAGIGALQFFVDGFARAVGCIKTWPGFEDIGQKMEQLVPHFMQKLKKVYRPNKPHEGINVLNHGDFHIKNILFINDENDDIQKISFIDFQISFWGTPAIDLAYVMYCNASSETRTNHRDDLIKIYHERFCEVLNQLGCLKSPPSLLDLHVEILKHGFLEILLAVQFMAMFYVRFEDIPKDATMLDLEEMTKTMYNVNMRADLEKLIMKFYYKGYLEL
ncbi:uncharacterized protein DMENIID0001_032520 [Sergentomyia squamirostris]